MELINRGYINENDIQIFYYDDLFKELLKDNSYKDLVQIIHYIVPRVVNRQFKDEDGKFIKNLEHGCGIPDKTLFNKELPKMLEKLKNKKIIIKEDSISYPCKNKVFTFKDKDDKFVLEII